MSNQDTENTEDLNKENLGELVEKKPSKKKLYIIIGAVLLIIIIGGAVGFFFYSKKHGESKVEESHGGESSDKHSTKLVTPNSIPEFIDMEEFLVNLNTVKKTQSSFLKMNVMLEIMPGSAKDDIQKFMPIIRDNLEMYLHELRAEDLQGSAGMYRLKEELLLRINKIIYPLQIKDVLFKNMLVQ